MQLANVDDPKVKKAVLANVITETVVSVVMACLVANQLSGGGFTEAVARKFKHWHDQVFGPPPPTEEEIKRQARLVHIEAARIVREAMP